MVVCSGVLVVCVWRCELKGDYGEEDRLVNCGKPVCLYFNNDIRVISDLPTSVKPHLKNPHN